MADSEYRKNNSIDERKKMFQKYREQNQNSIPIILEQAPKQLLKQLDRPEVLINQESKGQALLQYVKTKISVQNQSVFIYYGNTVLTGEDKLKDIYDKHKNEDGFLYLTYSTQDTQG